MKVVILAAGKGTRMMPLTKDVPKVLVEVNGKPFLWYVFKLFHSIGLTDIALIVGYKKEKVEEFLKEYGFTAALIEQNEQKGTGHAVMLAREFVGDDNFIVYYGDNLVSSNDLSKFNDDTDLVYVSGVEVEDTQKYGILLHEGNVLKEIVEKPQEYIGNLANGSMYKFTPEIFPVLECVTISPRGEIELTDAVTELAHQGKVKIISLKDYWLDLGSVNDVPIVEAFLRKLGQ